MGKASPDWVVVRLALGAIGALTVACDHLATKDEVARLVRHSGCHRAFIAAEHVAMLRELDGGGRVALHLLDEAAPGSGLASWRSLMSEAAGALPAFGSEAPTMLLHTPRTPGAPQELTTSSANIQVNLARRVGG